MRLLLDIHGIDHAAHMPHEALTNIAMQVDKPVASQAIKAQADQINGLISDSRQMAESRLQSIKEDACEMLNTKMQEEHQRLTVLKQHNPNISDGDIKDLETLQAELKHLLEKSSIKLDGIRLVVVSD